MEIGTMKKPIYLKQQKFIFLHSWKLKVQDKVLAGLVSTEASPALQMAAFSLCPHMSFSLWVHIPCSLFLYVLISSYKDTRHFGLEPTV